MPEPLGRRSLLRYGILGLPLAFAGLPIYVHVPKFYAETLQVNLATLGSLLLFIRLFDALIDPVIGLLSDRFHAYTKTIMAFAVPVLIAAYAMLFSPPDWAMDHAVLWLVGCLALVYLSFSTLMINYYALGVGMAEHYHDHTRVAAFREGSMLVGVLLASMLPALLLQSLEPREAYRLFSFALAPLLLAGAWVCLSATHVRPQMEGAGPSFFQLLGSPAVRWVLFIGFCNAIPTAITSTLFMFFTADVLHVERYSGPLLAVYFLSAAGGMPIWAQLSARFGKKRSLFCAMVVAIACFIWAWGLGEGDLVPFLIICILSGLTLGADSMLLPSMLADTLTDRREATATAFGLWNLTSKLTMAFAAGMALPLLASGGYHPAMENTPEALRRLSMCYALLPCLFKAVAASLLFISPIDKGEVHA